MPSFFVPGAEPDEDQEALHAHLAAAAGAPTPSSAERIYSITFQHDAETWTATVGEHPHGTRTRRRTRQGRRVDVTQQMNSRATVRAIFRADRPLSHPRGQLCLVVTDAPGNLATSDWANPFMATVKPQNVVMFD